MQILERKKADSQLPKHPFQGVRKAIISNAKKYNEGSKEIRAEMN